MDFSIPTNWQNDLASGIPSCNKKKEIKEVYGKLFLDDVGGGRIASGLSFVSKKAAERHIYQLRDIGLKFNYLLNAICMDNLEFTSVGQSKIRRLLDWLAGIGVDSVTVANPYLVMWVKRNYPSFAVNVSVMANVDSVRRARFWESLGVDKITFPGPVVNRNFTLLKQLRNSVKCKMQLVANNSCLCNCPTYIGHALMSCHASQSWHKSKGWIFDYYVAMCRLTRLNDIINFVRADWIRPEDVDFYADMGVDSIKLVDRRLPTDNLFKIISAYQLRTYRGNLADLFPVLQGKSFNSHKDWLRKIFYLGNVFRVNPFKVIKFSGLLSKIEVTIDNKKLDTFLKEMPRECDLISCKECGYCRKVATEAVSINKGYLDSALRNYKEISESLF
jgi:collagenase-like PrtC family protease